MGKILIIGLVVLLFSSCSKTKISKPKKISNRNIKISTEMRNEQRVALIIGNNEYKGNLSKLSNPINDARAIRDILKTRGFEVMYIENTSEKAMKKSIKDFFRKIKNGGVGVFYFSGHGIEVDGENYLIPTDADIKEKSETESEAISLTKITNRMQNTNNRLNIIILDACRNSPFSRAMGSGGLSKIEPRGLFVSYSTEAGKTASDGRVGGNGLFTKHLINYMKVPGLNLTDMFKKTRESVFIESNEKQFPA
ncbi:caspase family protein, partial [Sulfurovum sp. bin170]|uniref:caspase family protein n=1 Tax=Sulfurovum sp. bin170 TaxID=2695268 RepID=UPI0013DF59EB